MDLPGEVVSVVVVMFCQERKFIFHTHQRKDGDTYLSGSSTNDVYIRGTVKNEDTIELPSYWKDFVDQDSITVSLTPIGSHQNVIVKRIDKDKIYLQSQGLPIHCFYHVCVRKKRWRKINPRI